MAPGQYTLRAVATNTAGQKTTREMTLRVGESSLAVTAPLVSFEEPSSANGTVTYPANADISVRVDARRDPNNGVLDAIKNVRLFINEQFVRQENIFPYEWGASGQNDPLLQDLAPGEYRLKAVATNQGGRTTVRELGFIVTGGASASRAGTFNQKAALDSKVETLEDIVAYPNPVENVLSIRLSGDWGGDETKGYLSDPLGRRVRTLPSLGATSEIDLGNLPAGIYLLHLQNKGTSVSRRIYRK